MSRHVLVGSFLALVCLALSGCGEEATLPVEAGMGPNPDLPPPVKTLFPTVVIAEATGWPEGAAPIPAEGLSVKAFATGLDHPRMLYLLPNGDVLVAETAAPPQPGLSDGIMGWAMKLGMWWAGAGRFEPEPHHAAARRGRRRCGRNAKRLRLKPQLALRHGADRRYVLCGEYGWDRAAFHIWRALRRSLKRENRSSDLPAGPINIHWVKNILASPDGATLYAIRRLQQQYWRARHGQRGRPSRHP